MGCAMLFITLSQAYRVGYPLRQDETMADQWLEKALLLKPNPYELDIISSSEEALEALIDAYTKGIGSVPADPAKVNHWRGVLSNLQHKKMSVPRPRNNTYGL